MKTKLNLKSLAPHFIAAGIFLLISLIYFNPVLKGKTLPTHDIIQHEGAAKEVADFKEETGETSLWTNSMFGGMPTYQIATNYPNSLFIIKPIYKLLVQGLPKPLNILVLYFLGFYLLLVSFKVDWRLALAGALAYGFASYNIIIIDAGHNTKALAIGLAPFVLAAINMTLNHKYWILGAALTSVAMAFELKVNHVQITYYLLFIIAGMGVSWFITQIMNGHIKPALLRSAVLLAAIALGVGSNAGNIMVTAEYAKETTRGKSNIPNKDGKLEEGLPRDYITGWSYGVSETATFIIPNFAGGGYQNNMDFSGMEIYDNLKRQDGEKLASQKVAAVMYWGGQKQGTNGPVYIGAIICFLFVLGLFILDRSYGIWVSAVSLLAILLSWGSNFPLVSDLFIDYFPGYNKFRTVTMILTIIQITFPLTAILAVSKLLKRDISKEKALGALKWSLGIAGGFTLLFALVPGIFLDFYTDSEIGRYDDQTLDLIIAGRKSLLTKDAFRSLIFILISGGALYLYITEKLKQNILLIILIVGIGLDMWPVAGRFLGPSKFEKAKNEQTLIASRIDKQIMSDPAMHYRVLNLSVSPFNDATTSYFHESFGGYHGAKLKRIQELISNRVEGEINALTKSGFTNPDASPVLNMFNTKYFIAPTKKGNTLVPNAGAMGNAWFVEKVDILDDAKAEMDALKDIELRKTATTTTEFKDYLNGFAGGRPNGKIELVEYKPNYLKYKYNTDKESFAVFSDAYYRGNIDWISTIDGNKADHIRVNYLLRGMRVPAGEGIIEFKFDPPTYYKAETYSLISSLLIVLLLLGGGYLAYKGKAIADTENA